MISCPLWPDCGCGTQYGPHTCEYRAEILEEYKKHGIDPFHPNPDGSDHHLMNIIDEKLNAKYHKNK